MDRYNDVGRLVEATERLVDAWLNTGPRRDYHHYQQERLRKEWPTLYAAIEEVVKESR